MDDLTRMVTSSLLVPLSLLSFLPQYRKIRPGSDCENISLYYVLLNALVASQTFAFGLNRAIVLAWVLQDSRSPDSTSQTTAEGLDLSQHGVVWLAHLVLLGLCLTSAGPRTASKRTIIVAFAVFQLITVVPQVGLMFLRRSATDTFGGRDWVAALCWKVLHTLHPFVTSFVVIACGLQARELLQIRKRARRDTGAVSLSGLLMQAIVFGLLALSWLWRLQEPAGIATNLGWNRVYCYWWWYKTFGWAAINTGLYALGQLVLLLVAVMATRQWRGREVQRSEKGTPDETSHLLGV